MKTNQTSAWRKNLLTHKWYVFHLPRNNEKLATDTGEGNGTPLQHSCLENPMDGGAWWAAVHGVAKSWTQLSDFTFTFHFHALEKEMATHSSFLAWRIPGTVEPDGLPSMGSHRVGHNWSNLAAAAAFTWRRPRQPTPVLLPGKSHGWRSLVGCSPWGHKELATTEQLHFSFSFSCIGDGNGTQLQCSCLENPRDGEAWWAAIYGVAQSRTRLKRLSSSSSSSHRHIQEILQEVPGNKASSSRS